MRRAAWRAATAALLSVLALLGAGATSAIAGPGVVLKSQSGEPVPVPGYRIASSADSGGSYTVQESPDDKPHTISLRGLSMRGRTGSSSGGRSNMPVRGPTNDVPAMNDWQTMRCCHATGLPSASSPALIE